MNTKRLNVKNITTIGVLSGISIMLGMTPLGFIPIGAAKATTMHIPVIIGGIVAGPYVGGMVGLIFGIFSIIQAMSNPTPLSFAFLNPLVSVLPRVLIGISSAYIYIFLNNINIKSSKISVGLSAVVGSLVNTFGVLGMMYLIFAGNIVETMGLSSGGAGKFVMGIGLLNGIPEAIIAAIVTIGVINGLNLEKR